ncbi:hypothetical protein AAFF_G00055610 [Aldrovandia affinis]|uniref:Uncharacterized protein n=1 Tax=Aldrovandia affinis TaxID=143900 RepID=A0AAD7S141_9TELE|nr:hypothetical protein AAFF_G00055610 [Aldrovandia affinis]
MEAMFVTADTNMAADAPGPGRECFADIRLFGLASELNVDVIPSSISSTISSPAQQPRSDPQWHGLWPVPAGGERAARWSRKSPPPVVLFCTRAHVLCELA